MGYSPTATQRPFEGHPGAGPAHGTSRADFKNPTLVRRRETIRRREWRRYQLSPPVPSMSESTVASPASRLLIKHLLANGVDRAPTQEIVYADKRRLTYREFEARVHRLAGGLASLGVAQGDTVGVMDWDSHRYLECFFAVPMMGAVLHTINVRLSPEHVLNTINHAADDVILVNAEFVPLIAQIWDRVDPGKKLVLMNDLLEAPATALTFAAEYEGLLAGSHERFEFSDLDEEARATIFYTTGTTGKPKGVCFSHRQLVLHTLALRGALAGAGQLVDEAVYMPITPMFHVHAWGLPYVATLAGVKQVYPGRYQTDRLVELVRREGVSLSHCVPTILQGVLDQAVSKDVDLAGWTVIVGGAALAQSLARRALDAGVDILAGYGMSESGPVLTLAQVPPGGQNRSRAAELDLRCSAGRPIPMVEIRVVDAAMNELPRDGTSAGEVVVRAPWLTPGYFRDAAGSAKLWEGGWLHTGDIGVMGSDGYLRITDRIKDVIKTGGEWISSLQVEDLLLQHPTVIEAAVIGLPDPKWTERPFAVLVLKQGHFADEEDVKAHLSAFAATGAISKYGVPDRIVFVDALPRTSVGKVDKKLLRARFATLV
jgi:fatty-acyl-CoA synthase